MSDDTPRSSRRIASFAFCAAFLASAASAQTLSREEVAHVLRRVTFGPTPDQLSSITTQAQLDSYLNTQLNAPTTGYGTAAVWMNKFPSEPLTGANYDTHAWTQENLENKQLVLAHSCDYQLREVMTQFWEQHFNTNLAIVRGATGNAAVPAATKQKRAVSLEWRENDKFRQNALGSFRDLLRVSMNSVAMRLYLDAQLNCRFFNENYARELHELHTMGPGTVANPNYDYDDILDAMRVLRGMWFDEPTGDAAYITLCSDFARRTMFDTVNVPDLTIWPAGQAIPVNKTQRLKNQIRQLRNHIAAVPQTKAFICTKLITYFVGDDAVTPSLLNSCVTAWDAGAGNGNIKAILAAIFASSEFKQMNPQWERIELPLETVVSQARILEGELGDSANPSATSFAVLQQRLKGMRKLVSIMGAMPFSFPSPDGYPLASQRQLGTSVSWSVAEYAYGQFLNAANNNDLVYNPLVNLQDQVVNVFGRSWSNSGEIALSTLELIAPGRFSTQDLIEAELFLIPQGPGSWAPSVPDAERRVRLMLAFASTLPQSVER
ncbi:MAG: DUF1800 family protein [Planctomycetota bacterium]